uniref:Uncharacterized protein n=1 Tax=Rangifer tarandus platyrhynchus TaxID=3082113 RepID=A0ACB0ED58_RANTA|nr:unnamed protein product [Rangifer tarandus platyrhynchus]
MCHRAGKVQGYSPKHCGRIPEWRSQAKLCREPTMCVREGGARGNLRVKETLSRTGPEKGTNGKFPHTQAAPGPRLGRRLSHPGRARSADSAG